MTVSLPKQRHLTLEGVHNLRDLGGYATANGGQTRWHRFFRSDGLHALAEPAQQTLIDAGLRTVVDLRSQRELDEKPNVFANNNHVTYVHMPLFKDVGGAGGDLPNDLTTLYLRSLDEYPSAFKNVIDVIADSADHGVLFHCTAGKDRTGLISALLLGIATVDAADIVADYALTTTYLEDFFERRRAEAKRAGQDLTAYEPLFLAEPRSMRMVLNHLNAKYAGVSGYLEHVGVSTTRIEKIHSVFVETATAS